MTELKSFTLFIDWDGKPLPTMDDGRLIVPDVNGGSRQMDDMMQLKNGEKPPSPEYTMPGIIHFLQTEWTKVEMERSQWEVERAELQARIAFLQGERKGQENLKQDLVRRIKMLEFALKQERAKYHHYKYGNETTGGEGANLVSKTNIVGSNADGTENLGSGNDQFDPVEMLAQTRQQVAASNAKWKESRAKLRQYLQEVGYTDNILDVRQARVRQILGVDFDAAHPPSGKGGDGVRGGSPNGSDSSGGVNTGQSKRALSGRANRIAESLTDTEASVLATFDFLGGSVSSGGDVEEDGKGMEYDAVDDTEEALAEFDFLVAQQELSGGVGSGLASDIVSSASQGGSGSSNASTESGNGGTGGSEWNGVSPQLISKLKEQYRQERSGRASATSPGPGGSTSGSAGGRRPGAYTAGGLQPILAGLGGPDDIDGGGSYGGGPGAGSLPRPPPELDDTELKLAAEEEGFGAALGLGDLASLTVANEAMAGGEGSGGALDGSQTGTDGSGNAMRKTWTAKYTLRSHFDAIRDIAFHPTEQVLITASEDHTLKLWNLLSKTVQAKKSASFDVEPVYTFRGHAGPVLSLGVHPSGEEVYSGGVDGTVRVWHLINPNLDPYDAFDPSVHGPVLAGGHTDAVWSLAAHPTRSVLLSAGADGCVLAWQPDAGGGGVGVDSMLKSRITLQGGVVPTCLRFVSTDTSQYVVGTSSGSALLMDVETNKQVLCMDNGNKSGASDSSLVSSQVNCVVTHPTLPLTIAGYEDRQIRFFDNHTGKIVHSMVAHLDAVTSLGVDPNGLYLLSGSHDCSIRLWHLDNKTCVQEITSHRKKFNESINSVAFHPSKPYIASAGADALAKVFV